MKFGFRRPSLKSSISARTTGKFKRAVKRALIPGYGKKGMGWIHDPKKAMYNAVYHRTSFGLSDIFGAFLKPKTRHAARRTQRGAGFSYGAASTGRGGGAGGPVSGTPMPASGSDSSSCLGCFYIFLTIVIFGVIILVAFC